MGGKGGGAVATNNQMVAMQQQQAAEAAQANVQTQARLKQGVKEITQQFSGTPTGARQLDLSSIPGTPTSNPQSDAYNAMLAEYYASQGMSADIPSAASGTLSDGYTWKGLPSTGGAPSYGIFDPQNNLVTDATSLDDLSKAKIYIGGDPSQTTGGFDQGFYDKFRNAITSYYLPQEDQQYQDARSALSYSLARAGALGSSTEATDVAKLAQEDTIAQANIQSQADQQTGNLRTTIANDEQSALNQLYSTEDPTVAANTAENMVANADLTKPVMSPLTGLFNTISVGVGNALTGFMNPYAYINTGAQGMSAGTTPGSGQVTSGGAGSGSTQQGY
jgi:hypothetical protein